MRIQNKIAVITGAGSGIGLSTALKFAREGARVLAVDLDPNRAAKAAAEIHAIAGREAAHGLVADISTESGAELGTSLCSKHAVEAMKKQGGGSIVNVASINGLIAMPDWMTYNCSKAAVVEMSKSMAMDLAPFNIRVNCVCPGVTDTPALRRA